MPRRPIDREDVIGAIDATIMQLLAAKAMLQGLDDDQLGADVDPWQEICPERDDGGLHVVLWSADVPPRTGMCRRCGAEFADESVGVSGPGGA